MYTLYSRYNQQLQDNDDSNAQTGARFQITAGINLLVGSGISNDRVS